MISKFGRCLCHWGKAIVLLLILPACVSTSHLKHPAFIVSSPELILRQIEKRKKNIQGLKGRARIKFLLAGKTYQLTEVIVAKSPHLLRLETVGFFGNPISFFTFNGKESLFFSPRENKFYRKVKIFSLLAEIFPLDLNLEVKELASIILGNVPLLPHNRSELTVLLRKDSPLYLLKLLPEKEKSYQLLWVDPCGDKVIKSETYDSSGALSYRIEFADYQKMKGLCFPEKITLQIFPSKDKLVLTFCDFTLNPEIEGNIFTLTPPAGTKIIEIN